MFGLNLLLFVSICALTFCSYTTLAGTFVFTPLAEDNEDIQVPTQQIGPEYVAIDNNSSNDVTATNEKIEDAKFWHKVGMNQLKKIITNAENYDETAHKRKAKNIIIFLGDGMGLSTITAGRIYKGQQLKHGNGEEETLSFDEFPYTGLAKTYNVDYQVPDSAGTATALFCGVKTDMGAIGMDVTRSKTNGTRGSLKSIMDWAQAEGKRTGIVTTTRITHATPAATYARVFDRNWECDANVPAESVGQHIDIARQLVENSPGNLFNVIMGGGLANMGALNPDEVRSTTFDDDINKKYCKRIDGRNLVQEWLNLGSCQDDRAFVQTRDELNKVDLKKVDKLMGLFRNDHMAYSLERRENEPSLKEMTEAAISVLERDSNSKGYVLLVEGGRIDHGHHQNYAHAALQELLEFDKAIEAALNATNVKETLIIITADHSHSMTLNGYPKRGNNILGFTDDIIDKTMVYETISYANGPGFSNHISNGTSNSGTPNIWIDLQNLSEEKYMAPNYRHLAPVLLKDETHGGEDVIVFAHGPGSSLVRGVFEQNYVAYVMSYAACMGPAKEFDNTCKT